MTESPEKTAVVCADLRRSTAQFVDNRRAC